MSVAANLGLIALSIGLLLSVMTAVRLAARQLDLSAELQRKIVHVATGFYALTLPVVFTDRWPVLLLVALSVSVMLILRLPAVTATGLGSALHAVNRKSYGEIYLALAVGFLFFRSQENPVLFVLPVLILTISDAAAALVGTSYGRRLFAVEAGTKSIEGVAVFFVVAWLLSMIVLTLAGNAPGASIVVLSLLVAAFSALVEAQSWKGLDNLFVPIGVHLFLDSHLTTPPTELILFALAFVATIASILAFAPVFRLEHHAARSYTVLIFLVCSVTEPFNAVLPVAAILAHIWARLARPSRSEYPDLDLLAVSTGVALVWLFAGEYFDRTAINLFNLTFAAAAASFAALALRDWYRLLCIPVAIALGAAVFAITGLNPAPAHWHGPLWPWVAGALTLSLGAPLLRPDQFDRARSVRVFTGAMVVPVALFLTRGLSP